MKYCDECNCIVGKSHSHQNSESVRVDAVVMCCDGCKYLGQRIEHLNDFGDGKWYDCKYPLPFHVHNKAVPWVPENECKCKAKKT